MTGLNSTVATSIAALTTIGEGIKRLQEEAKAARQNALQPFLEALAASGQVSMIVIRGSTPGFNDGEPCTHSADIFVNMGEIIRDEVCDSIGLELPDELVDGIQWEKNWSHEKREYEIDQARLESNRELCREHGHVYDDPSPEIAGAINALIFETAEEENGTDYYVAYVLKDGKFEMTSGEYDCGY